MTDTEYRQKLSECSISDPSLKKRSKFLDKFSTQEFTKIWESAPSSSETKVILSWDQESKEYSIVDFHPSYVGNRISYSDINPVINSLKEIPFYDMEGYINKKQNFHNLLLIIPILTIALLIFMLADHIDIDIYNEPINLAWFLTPLLSIELTMILIMRKSLKKSFEQMIMLRQLQIDNILNCWNENKFGLLSLHLSSGKMGAWLQLEILHRYTGAYMPLGNWRKDENEKRRSSIRVTKDIEDCFVQN